MSASDHGMMLVALFAGSLVCLYIFKSICLSRIARKLGDPKPWLAWIPFANLYLMLRIARKPVWWMILFVVPYLRVVLDAKIWIAIAVRREKSWWLGIFAAVPIVDWGVNAYLAFSGGQAGELLEVESIYKKSAIREWSEILAWTVPLIFANYFLNPFDTYSIPSGAMEDTIMMGDFMVAQTGPLFSSDTKPGDIVIFEHPNPPDGVQRKLVKRCVAMAGQTVEVRNKDLYVNGILQPLPPGAKHIDPNTYPATANKRDNFGSITVPPGSIFVLGDNRDNSDDSRFWGFVPLKNIKARPLCVYFSWRHSPDQCEISTNPGSIVPSIIQFVTHFSDNTRWDRIGTKIH